MTYATTASCLESELLHVNYRYFTADLRFAYKVFRFVIHFYQNMVVLHMQTVNVQIA